MSLELGGRNEGHYVWPVPTLGWRGVGSKDCWARLLSAMAQSGPGDLGGIGDLGDGATPVSTVCFISPKCGFPFLIVPENGELFL